MRALLNVGGGKKTIAIPPYYAGWRHDVLDIDPAINPDIVMDARELHRLPAAVYDAVYCSHNLEHYYRHDGIKVIEGFKHVLKEDGFVEVRVPDLESIMKHAVRTGMDIDDVLYNSRGGPILLHDVFYGHHALLAKMGNDFYAHKTGFTPKSLLNFFAERGFGSHVLACYVQFEITGYFFRDKPSKENQRLLGFVWPLNVNNRNNPLESDASIGKT